MKKAKNYCFLVAFAYILCTCVGKEMQYVRKMEPVNFSKVEINDAFWKPLLTIHANTTLDVCLDQCEHATGRVKNFAVAAKVRTGEFDGLVYDDSDLYKMIEGVAYSLTNQSNPRLEAKIDTIIDYIAKAQCEDGYLMTYYILGDMSSRWTDMDKHEMYCCGHLIEAAIAYDDATGKRKLLDVAIRFADHICNTFGPDKRNWVPGHQEIELAMVKLYYKTGDVRYLNMADWLLSQRGHGRATWKSTDYYQDVLPVKQQRKISGHAVRAMYLFTAMADVAAAKNDPEYIAALDTLWHDVVDKKMYLTGGIGSSKANEGFTKEYDLPNAEAYCETCASVGMVLWNHRMNLLSKEAKYVDVLERAMYNGAIAGISLTGDKFFYVNPLESNGDHHRKVWYRTACCPSQISRFLPSIGNYIYAVSDDDIWVNLYIGNNAKIVYKGKEIAVRQTTNYPWDGNVRLEIRSGEAFKSGIKLRIPSWCENYEIWYNGKAEKAHTDNGYATLKKRWEKGDVVELVMEMDVKVVQADPRVEANAGKRAIQRGPLVYCMEEIDNPGYDQVSIIPDLQFTSEFVPALLNGVVEITAASDGSELRFVPYYAWDNRDAGKMKVWVDFKE